MGCTISKLVLAHQYKQHYNPIADAKRLKLLIFQQTRNYVPSLYLAGSIEAPAGEKTYMDDAARFKTFN